MKTVIVFLSVLSFVGVSNAWFLDLNKKFGKTGKLAKAPSSNRKVVLEPRIAYFPVSVITDENDKPILGSPFAPPLAAPGSVYEGRQQPEYASLYAQPPLVMYGSPETAGTIYSAPAPVSGQYHAVYSYLAADPYAQYAAAPLEYETLKEAVSPYSPSDGYSETEAPATAEPVEAYTTA